MTDPRERQFAAERDAAIEIAHRAMQSSYIGKPPKLRGDAERMVDALIGAGWGPRSAPDEPESTLARWLLAEAEWERDGWREDANAYEQAARHLLAVLGYDPDGHVDLVVAACAQARQELVEWRRDWNKPPWVFAISMKDWPGRTHPVERSGQPSAGRPEGQR